MSKDIELVERALRGEAFPRRPPGAERACPAADLTALSTCRSGRPGFVSDGYLNAISAETTTTVLELEASGMWERRDCGYLIVADDMLKVAIDFNEKTDRLEAECARRGEHLPSDGDDGSGWVTCSHCTIPIKRPDGGPVALPGGGPLGPDPRQRKHNRNKGKRKRRS